MKEKIISSVFLLFLICLISTNINAEEFETTEEIITSDTTQQVDETFAKNENVDEMKMQGPYNLPADSESIRPNIVDSQFTCDEKEPGYYADVENECQIFHRCLEERPEVYSFICPESTKFDQRVLVCIWDDDYDFDCSESAKFFHVSNRAFMGNITAEHTMTENIKNSHEIKNSEVEKNNEIKFYEIISSTSSANEEEEEFHKSVEENTVEDIVESTSTSEEIEDSNDYQAELIPSSLNHMDASIATSADSSISISHPQKISFFIDKPIVEIPSAPANNIDDGEDDQMHESVTNIRNLRKRSGNHRNRFLFKADNKASQQLTH